MPARIFTVAQQKGGAGKTTLVAHLAIGFASLGYRVSVIDIDPQGSLKRWVQLRDNPQSQATFQIDGSGVSGWRLSGLLREKAETFDIVLIDSPPHADTDARVAIRGATQVIVPCQASPLDLWASRPTLDLARSEGRPAMIVMNRTPPRGRLLETSMEAAQEFGVPVAERGVGNRVAFAAAIGLGLGIEEYAPRSKGAAEIRTLAAELVERSS